MDSGDWIVYWCIFFIFLAKFVEYTSPYHDKWVSKFSLTSKGRKLSDQYRETLEERQKLQEENHSISAQDNYARWTKNNRKISELNKRLSGLRDKLQENSVSSKKLLGTLKLLALTIPFWVLKIWQRNHVVYRLPREDLFPKLIAGIWARGWLYVALGPLQYLRNGSLSIKDDEALSTGVSLGIWIWAFQTTISTISFLIRRLILEKPIDSPLQKSKDSETQSHIEKKVPSN